MSNALKIAVGVWLLLGQILQIGCSDENKSPTPVMDGDTEKAENESEVPQGLFHNPRDGRLYAAAKGAIITPNKINHPCPFYMGGTGSGRLATGTHDDLEVRVVVLEQNGVHAIFASLDAEGWLISDIDPLWDALAKEGVDPHNVIISCTHSHTAADLLGVYGPDDFVTGRCAAYAEWLRATILGLVHEIVPNMKPVTLYAGETTINESTSNHPSLINDTRFPFVVNDHLNVARLDDTEGKTIVSLVNWNSHPETMIDFNVYSADFPRYTRQVVESNLGGVAVYISGTVGGMSTPLGLSVPKRDENGKPVLDENGQQMLVGADEKGEEKMRSLGWIVGDYATQALKNAKKIEGLLRSDFEIINIPIDNLIFVLGFKKGVLPMYDHFIKSKECGILGCIPQPISHLQIGTLHFVNLPGEVLAETSIGRAASTKDWGGTYGVMEYPAIEGYRGHLPTGHVLFEFGLGNNEIGYILPASDYLSSGNPGYYEEYFTVATTTEKNLREAINRLLDRSER